MLSCAFAFGDNISLDTWPKTITFVSNGNCYVRLQKNSLPVSVVGSHFFSTTTIRCSRYLALFPPIPHFSLTVRALFHFESHGKLLPLHSHKLLRCCDSNNMIEIETNLFDTKLFQYKFNTNSSSETIAITSSIVCVKWRMILVVVNAIYATACEAWKNSGLQLDLNPLT